MNDTEVDEPLLRAEPSERIDDMDVRSRAHHLLVDVTAQGLSPAPQRHYERLVSRSGHFNIAIASASWWSQLQHWSPYHTILNLPWWQLLASSAFYWAAINLLFGLLYYVDIGRLEHAYTLFDAFFFSVCTMSTVGYGNIFPKSVYLQILVATQSWLALIADSVLVAIFISKVARPSRLRHTVQFSDCATINCREPTFSSENAVDNLAGIGVYSSSDVPVLTLRVLNLRKRQLCSPSLRLYVLKRDAQSRSRSRILYELDYELAYQTGRARSINYALPHLPLPWTLVHRIDELSALKGLSYSAMLKQELEIIAVLDAIDELTSANFQVRWSYLPSELRWGHSYEEMVSRDSRGRLKIDIKKLSATIPINSDGCRSPEKPL